MVILQASEKLWQVLLPALQMAYSITLKHEDSGTYLYGLLSESLDTYLSPSAL